jgi:hypothetical protein
MRQPRDLLFLIGLVEPIGQHKQHHNDPHNQKDVVCLHGVSPWFKK